MKRLLSIVGILILISIGIIVFHPITNSNHSTSNAQPTSVSSHKQNNTFTYKGQEGKDALTLLKAQTKVEQDHSGLVVSINGNKPTGHAYWAFYVNGKLASVGPAQYLTKNADVFLWKIEKY